MRVAIVSATKETYHCPRRHCYHHQQRYQGHSEMVEGPSVRVRVCLQSQGEVDVVVWLVDTGFPLAVEDRTQSTGSPIPSLTMEQMVGTFL